MTDRPSQGGVPGGEIRPGAVRFPPGLSASAQELLTQIFVEASDFNADLVTPEDRLAADAIASFLVRGRPLLSEPVGESWKNNHGTIVPLLARSRHLPKDGEPLERFDELLQEAQVARTAAAIAADREARRQARNSRPRRSLSVSNKPNRQNKRG